MSSHKVSHTCDYPVPIEDFFSAIIDYAAYPDFIAPIQSVAVLNKTKNNARVRFNAHYFRDVHYTLDLTHRRPFEVSWKLVGGNAFKRMTGSWELQALEDCLTRVTYEADVALHISAPGFMIRHALRSNLPAMMDAFFEHAQASSR